MDLLYSKYKNSAKIYLKKKKLITENPYKKNEYGFGDSNLENKPILNLENKMKYNKYFKYLYRDLNDNKT